MITQEEFNNGLELVKNDDVFRLFHPVYRECAMMRIGSEIVMSLGSILIYCDDVSLSNGLMKFTMKGADVGALNTEQFIVDNEVA